MSDDQKAKINPWTRANVRQDVEELHTDILKTLTKMFTQCPQNLRYEMKMQVEALFKKLWKEMR